MWIYGKTQNFSENIKEMCWKHETPSAKTIQEGEHKKVWIFSRNCIGEQVHMLAWETK